MRRLATVVLCVAIGAAAAVSHASVPLNVAAAEAEPAWIGLVRGRARVSYGGQTFDLRSDAPLALRVGALLEVDAGARATLAFPARASMSIEGPARVSFAPSADMGADVVLDVELARELMVEARGTRTLLRHPCGFEIEARRGMCRLAELPGGALELENQGGAALRLASLQRRAPGTWPSRLASGERARLERAEP